MRHALAASVMVVCAAVARPGRTDPADADPRLPACVQAYEQAQVLRRAAKLRAAREQLLLCVQDACPAVARQDCTTWLDQVESSLPSVSVSVVDRKGAPALQATVTVDGASIPDWASGRAIVVDPGKHEVRATRSEGETAVATVLVVEGRRNQPVALQLGAAPRDAARERAGAPETGSAAMAPWIFGGVALIGLGGFAGFGIAAIARESELEHGCSPGCTPEQIDGVRTLRIVSGISLGVGVAAAVATVVSFLLSDEDAAAPRQGSRSRSRAGPWLDAGRRHAGGFGARF